MTIYIYHKTLTEQTQMKIPSYWSQLISLTDWSKYSLKINAASCRQVIRHYTTEDCVTSSSPDYVIHILIPNWLATLA